MWQQHLLELALLGTEKKALDAENLPGDIRDFIAGRHPHDPELKYLEAVSLTYFYHAAGKNLSKFSGTIDEKIITETKPIAAPGLLEIFSRLETIDYELRENLFNRWLNVLTGQNTIVSPELIIRLLNTGNNFSNQTKSKITEVIGNKGAWVLSYSDTLNYKPPVSGDHLWEEGTQQERKNLFSAMRKDSLARSLSMLRSTWDNESVVNKRSFLEIIRDTSGAEDLSFVEALFEAEFKFQPKEKKTEKECRRILSGILLKHPDTKLYSTTATALSRYFSKAKKGLVGLVTGKDQATFVLPTAEDAFWNAQTMEQVYGFETKNLDIAIYSYPAQFWLSGFIAAMPADFWAQPFGGDHHRMLDYFLDNEQYRTKVRGEAISILQEEFIENARYHHNSALAEALVQRFIPQKALPLLSLMRVADYEAYVKKNKFYGDAGILQHGPFDHDHPWSLPFSQQVVASAYELAMQNTATPQLGKVIAQYLHKDVYNDLLRYHDKAQGTGSYDGWNRNIFLPVHATLEVRNLIDSFKK